MKLIKFYNDGADSTIISSLAQKFGVNKKVIEIAYSRGYKTESDLQVFFNPANQSYYNPFLLSGMKEATEKISWYAKNNKDILIFGDYDVDGMSATAIMIKMLKKLGVNARYYLPNRFIDGYGLTCDVIDKICKDKKPDVIITVDCGITCYKEVEYCKELGIDIIITDHHELPEITPNTIVINPKIPNQNYNFNGLCGTGVAFKISQAILGETESEEFLPIATIATIADIVPLTSENRIIVAKGLKVMDKYLPYGLKAIFKQNKINLSNLDANDIAFKIAPKLNASGRMGSAEDSLELMLETDPVRVKELLQKVNDHNTKRQTICTKVFDDCMAMLKNEDMSKLPAIILKSDKWDSGILGIVCSRLLDIYNRPVILLAQNGHELKGSARSIEDVNIHQVLSSVNDLLVVFGGHKVAAGLTLKVENFEEFKNKVNSFIFENVNSQAFIPIDYYDVELSLNDLNDSLFNDLKLLEPCGCENAKPKFLIKTNKVRISRLSPKSVHAYININDKLNLIYFNYLKDYPKLNFGKYYEFVFELQSKNKSGYKGLIKNFDSSNEIKDSSDKYFNAFKLNQLRYETNDKIDENRIKTYEDKSLLDFFAGCASSSFGTCFICFDASKYKQFLQDYDLKNIYDINFLECRATGFNTLNLSPIDINFVNSYKKIVFLDAVYDKGYLCQICQNSTAEIYIPKIENNDVNMILNLDISRENITKFYRTLQKIDNEEFTSLIGLHSKILRDLKTNFSFSNFLFYYYIFSELNIINPGSKDGLFTFTINKNIKTDLNKSNIYNKVKLIRKIYGKN